jgi:hypothetical protein
MELIGLIIAGIIVGFLGKFIAPGDKDNTPVGSPSCAGSEASSSARRSTPLRRERKPWDRLDSVDCRDHLRSGPGDDCLDAHGTQHNLGASSVTALLL